MQFRNLSKLLLIVLFAGLSACSAAGGSTNSNKPVDVHVTANEYAFQSSMTTFKVGVPYHFIVTNKGTVEHEFMIVKPIEAGTMDMEEMDSMALADIEDDDLQPGQTASVDYTFTKAYPAGTLEFSCHIKGHYEAGMKLPITVQ
jgi:uncharacterized cupredoxin-like copper-binding protein